MYGILVCEILLQLIIVDDGPLTELKNECGEAAYNSVIKAFKETEKQP